MSYVHLCSHEQHLKFIPCACPSYSIQLTLLNPSAVVDDNDYDGIGTSIDGNPEISI